MSEDAGRRCSAARRWPARAAWLVSLTPVAGIASGVSAEATDDALATITVEASGASQMNAASAGDIGAGQIASEPLLAPQPAGGRRARRGLSR